MQPKNLLIIMSDQHNRRMLGCYGHDIVTTPNLDRLAARGTLFTDAYTPCPVCVPARASFATGKYVHQIGNWDNAIAYDGTAPSWHHQLREMGHHVVSIGKLHFRSKEDDNGFSDEQIGMHIIEGKGDLLGLIRDEDMPKRGGSYKMAKMAGPGESPYTIYDREIAARAQVWFRESAQKHTAKPWVMFLSFVSPHFPLTAPPEHFYRYYDRDLPVPKRYGERHEPAHPYIEDYKRTFAYDEFFKTPDMVKRALAGYLGLCSFLDENIGKVLASLEAAGLAAETRVVYTSDHGDNLGARGLWGKSTMYEESVGVPLIAAGPDIPAGRRVGTPTNLLDLYPFIMDSVGAGSAKTITPEHPGRSIADIIAKPDDSRAVFSEYHGMGSKTAAYMLRKGPYKLVYYAAYPPQLFDLSEDPEELNDIADKANAKPILEDLQKELLKICDPLAVDRKAKADQARLLEASGGKPAVIARGDLGFSPPPGVTPDFN
ncbi:MAG: sulfatase-like hydrolase/transferase [Hyphomicrobiaceae bacterium]